MSGDRVPMTPDGYKKLQKELQKLKTVDRQEVIKLIEYARSLGDLSENAEYETAKDKQSFIETRIQELEGKLGPPSVCAPSARWSRHFGQWPSADNSAPHSVQRSRSVTRHPFFQE